MAKKNESGYLSAKESRRISRENRKITDQFEKLHKRKNVPEEEFLTQMHDQNNSLEIENLHTYFFSDVGTVRAVDGVSFDVPIGKTVGVVGESGCGKSTLGRLLLRLYDVTDGQIIYDGTDITKLNAKELKPIRARMQMIFQDPSGSLDPRKSVKELIGEPLKIYKACKNRDEYDARIAEIMQRVSATSWMAAAASASALAAHWPWTRSSSSATSRSLHWTFPFRHRS